MNHHIDRKDGNSSLLTVMKSVKLDAWLDAAPSFDKYLFLMFCSSEKNRIVSRVYSTLVRV